MQEYDGRLTVARHKSREAGAPRIAPGDAASSACHTRTYRHGQ